MPEKTAHGWPLLMRLSTAAAYLDMTTASFLGEVGRGGLPTGMMFAGGERWDRHAIAAALDQPPEDDWRRHQPGLAEADPASRIIDRSR